MALPIVVITKPAKTLRTLRTLRTRMQALPPPPVCARLEQDLHQERAIASKLKPHRPAHPVGDLTALQHAVWMIEVPTMRVMMVASLGGF